MPARAAHQGGSVQYEDTLGVDGDSGVSILAFRNDVPEQLATADLSHTRLSADEFGRLSTNANLQIGDADVDAANPIPIGGLCYTVAANPVLTVAGAYIAGDYVGTSATAMTFTNVVRDVGESGVIESIVLIDQAAQSVSLELWLFDTAPTPPADNAAWTIADADALTCIAVVPFQVYYASALNSVSNPKGLGLTFNTTGATRNIYGCLVTRGTPTYASLDLMVRLQILVS